MTNWRPRAKAFSSSLTLLKTTMSRGIWVAATRRVETKRTSMKGTRVPHFEGQGPLVASCWLRHLHSPKLPLERGSIQINVLEAIDGFGSKSTWLVYWSSPHDMERSR